MGFLQVLALIAVFLLTGCMVGPDYTRPTVDVPNAWRFQEKEAGDLANTAWWEQFRDPVLNGLIQVALKENKDLRIATARVEEFFGRYFSTRGDQFPLVGGGGSASRERVTEKGPTPIPAGVDNPFDYYQAFLGGSWELDFWGRLRRASESARAELFSTEEARRTVILTLVSAVATAYVDIRALDKQLEITRPDRPKPQGNQGPVSVALQSGGHFRGGSQPGGIRIPGRPGTHSGPRARHRPNRKCPERPARPQPGADPPRPYDRRACLTRGSIRPAIRVAGKKARHPPGGAGARGRQRPNRGGQGSVFPDHFPDRVARHGEHRPVGSLQRSVQGLELRRSLHHPYLHSRPHRRRGDGR